MGKPMEEYKAIMKSQDLHTVLTGDRILSFMNCNTTSYLYSILRHIPFLGDTVLNYRHRHFLEIVAKDTRTIMKKILIDSII